MLNRITGPTRHFLPQSRIIRPSSPFLRGQGAFGLPRAPGSLTGIAGDTTVTGLDGAIAFSGDITPSQITSDQNDYNPTGLSSAAVVRVDSDQDGRIITGLSGGSDGRIITFENIGDFCIIFSDQNTGSSAANRFSFANGGLHLVEGQQCTLLYDGTDSRWVLLSCSMGPWFRRRLATGQVNSNATANTLEDVTGLSFYAEANKTYAYRVRCPYTSAATTTGSRWTINGPASPTAVYYRSSYTLTATTLTTNYQSAYNGPATSNATSLTAGNMATIDGFLRNGATAGTVQVRHASEVANSAITALAISSYIEWTELKV